MKPFLTHQVGSFTVEIHQDTDVENPRNSMDNVGTLGFVRNNEYTGEESLFHEEVADKLNSADPDLVAIPVYAYSHSGLSFSLEPFNDRFDSGRIGCIYASVKEAQEKFGFIGREAVKKALESEIDVLSQYVEGEVYGYIILDSKGEETDSCWGFFGLEYCEEEAKSQAGMNQLSFENKVLEEVQKMAAFTGVDIG